MFCLVQQTASGFFFVFFFILFWTNRKIQSLTPCRSLLMVLTELDTEFTALPHDSRICREELVPLTNEVRVVFWPFWGVRSYYLYLTHYICYQWWDMTSHIRIVTQRSVLDRWKDRQKDYLWPENKKCPASTLLRKIISYCEKEKWFNAARCALLIRSRSYTEYSRTWS